METSAKGFGVVIDASRRFARPLERIVFDPACGGCRSVEMSIDELHTLIELLKGQFDELLRERRATADAR